MYYFWDFISNEEILDPLIKMKKLLVVVGTRPNFIKVTQFKKESNNYDNIDLRIVHTGQHFDSKMADIFFKQFELKPDYYLNIPSGSPNEQMAEIMLRLEKLIVSDFTPDLIIVIGDVNSTLAAALTANKLGIKIAHVESGLRSYDSTMPEETNRILTDAITDYYFVTEQSGVDNLLKEGKNIGNIYFVGNTMIDTLIAYEKEIDSSEVLKVYNLNKKDYVLMTMHRPATVDFKEGLIKLLELIRLITANITLVFPIHPRTKKNIEKFGLQDILYNNSKIIITDPLDYFAFQKLTKNAKFIITDSGGIQEESTYYNVACLTLRPNTERPVTCEIGSNVLLSFDLTLIKNNISNILNNDIKKHQIPPKWDGHTSERIMKIISTL